MSKLPAGLTPRSSLVVRSAVPALTPYTEYKQHLRKDFFHSCAYCNMSEAEARAVRFTIDHYEPQGARPDLQDEYFNLMYCCDECNRRKGDRSPPQNARDAGIRFFKADGDEHSAHYEIAGLNLDAKTPIAHYTINAIDLNRAALRRLRELRKRIVDCDRAVAEGVMALRTTPLDRFPKELRGRIMSMITASQRTADLLGAEIDDILRSYAKSDLIEPDPESAKRASERAKELKGLEAMHPGNWRAPRQSRRQTV